MVKRIVGKRLWGDIFLERKLGREWDDFKIMKGDALRLINGFPFYREVGCFPVLQLLSYVIV